MSGGAPTAAEITELLAQVVDGRPAPLPGGVVRGTVRRTDDGLKLSAFELIVDTQDSIPLKERA